MKTLVIHPEDPSTGFLSHTYWQKDWTVFNSNLSSHQTYSSQSPLAGMNPVPEVEKLEDLLLSHDRIISMGHGTPSGLLNPISFHISNVYHLLNFEHVPILKEKEEFISIWCNSDRFIHEHGIKSPLFTGMIISETIEAQYCKVPLRSPDEIEESNLLFAQAIRAALDEKDKVKTALSIYQGSSKVIQFNRKRIFSNTN